MIECGKGESIMTISERFKEALHGALRSLLAIAPMLFAVIGLVGLFDVFVTPEMLHSLFIGNALYDALMGTLVGGISVGQPFLSYIIGGELLKEGVSYYAISAFILAWVTLGLVQLPLEWSLFGGRFTIIRNLLALLFAMLIAFVTTVTIGVLG